MTTTYEPIHITDVKVGDRFTADHDGMTVTGTVKEYIIAGRPHGLIVNEHLPYLTSVRWTNVKVERPVETVFDQFAKLAPGDQFELTGFSGLRQKIDDEWYAVIDPPHRPDVFRASHGLYGTANLTKVS